MSDRRKKKKAAALKYFNTEQAAPVITALGNGVVAEKIIQEAEKNGVDVMESADFFAFEHLFAVGGEIPPDVYKIVVEILQYILHTNVKG